MISPARQHAGTGQRVGQMDLVVPAAPVRFDLGIDLAVTISRQFGSLLMGNSSLARWKAGRRD
jgi:hypothetical protein